MNLSDAAGVGLFGLAHHHVGRLTRNGPSKGQATIPREVRDALGLTFDDQIVFRAEEHRPLLARTAELLELAGRVDLPVATRGAPWDEARREARRVRATERR